MSSDVPIVRRNTQALITPDVQALICERIAATGNLADAAAVALTTPAVIRRRAERDEAFAEALRTAWQDFKDLVLIPAATSRAVQGVRRGVYYKGQIARDEHGEPVYEQHYSDQLLLKLLEVLDPRFRTHTVQEIKAQVGPAQIDELTPEQKRKLEDLLRTVQDTSHVELPPSPTAPEEDPELESPPDAPAGGE